MLPAKGHIYVTVIMNCQVVSDGPQLFMLPAKGHIYVTVIMNCQVVSDGPPLFILPAKGHIYVTVIMNCQVQAKSLFPNKISDSIILPLVGHINNVGPDTLRSCYSSLSTDYYSV